MQMNRKKLRCVNGHDTPRTLRERSADSLWEPVLLFHLWVWEMEFKSNRLHDRLLYPLSPVAGHSTLDFNPFLKGTACIRSVGQTWSIFTFLRVDSLCLHFCTGLDHTVFNCSFKREHRWERFGITHFTVFQPKMSWRFGVPWFWWGNKKEL